MEHIRIAHPVWTGVGNKCISNCPACVEEATLKAVGVWLNRRTQIYSKGYGYAFVISDAELLSLLRGEMPQVGV